MDVGMIVEVWGLYEPKETLSSDTKYDVKLKGLSLQSKGSKER